MIRRSLAAVVALAAAGALLGATPALAQNKTLRVVAHADVKILDPTFTTAYISRNFGYMVYDTLFANDVTLQPRPQMVDKSTVSRDRTSAVSGNQIWCPGDIRTHAPYDDLCPN